MVSKTQHKTEVRIPWKEQTEKQRQRERLSQSRQLDLLTFDVIAQVMTAKGHPMSASLAFAICKRAQKKIMKALAT